MIRQQVLGAGAWHENQTWCWGRVWLPCTRGWGQTRVLGCRPVSLCKSCVWVCRPACPGLTQVSWRVKIKIKIKIKIIIIIFINIINIIINQFLKKYYYHWKKTIDLILRVKLKIIVVVVVVVVVVIINNFFKKYYCYWRKTINFIWRVKLLLLLLLLLLLNLK